MLVYQRVYICFPWFLWGISPLYSHDIPMEIPHGKITKPLRTASQLRSTGASEPSAAAMANVEKKWLGMVSVG